MEVDQIQIIIVTATAHSMSSLLISFCKNRITLNYATECTATMSLPGVLIHLGDDKSHQPQKCCDIASILFTFL